MKREKSIKEIIDTLNYHKPQHPPDIYFIRRNPKFLKKYLDPIEMDGIIKDAKNKKNYEMFKLDPKEVSIIETLHIKKRKELNPNDPFFFKYRKPFEPSHCELLGT